MIEGDADLAALVSLAALPGIAPKKVWALVDDRSPSVAWSEVRAGGRTLGRASGEWADWARSVDPAEVLGAHRRHGVRVVPYGASGYPSRLLDDPEPPAVLFTQGPSMVDERVAIAIVGTRRCTRYGTDIARELGGVLAERGILVVSGLAHGIDAAAHAGAGRADPACCVAVVAGGVDAVYPANNRGLWHAVARSGLLLSEWPLGASARPWRFPARNRLVAALSVAVVVVESGVRGGSMYTVDEALQRDRVVFAVPGSIRSPSSFGTNRLIAEGATLLDDIAAFADALAPRPRETVQTTLALGDPESSWLLDLIGWEPATVEQVLAASDKTATEVTIEIEMLLADGRLARSGSRLERLQ